MMRAIRLSNGPVKSARDLVVSSNVIIPTPGESEVLVRNVVSGVNMLDVYHRTGLYPMPPNGILGAEGAGVVVKAGSPKLSSWVGKRVAYFYTGTLAEFTAVPSARLIEVSKDISLEQALVLQIQGLTAHYLTHTVFPLKQDHWALIMACGSGTGNLAAQIAAKICKAHVVGTCSSSKVAHAKATIGSDAKIVDYSLGGSPGSSEWTADLIKRLKHTTPEAKGFHVVYDSVGKSTYQTTLDVLRPRGLACFFGNSSGAVPPLDLFVLSRNSLSITRFAADICSSINFMVLYV